MNIFAMSMVSVELNLNHESHTKGRWLGKHLKHQSTYDIYIELTQLQIHLNGINQTCMHCDRSQIV